MSDHQMAVKTIDKKEKPAGKTGSENEHHQAESSGNTESQDDEITGRGDTGQTVQGDYQKYTDRYFNIKDDFKKKRMNCISGLPPVTDADEPLGPSSAPTSRSMPGGVMRVSQIFDDPKFFQESGTLGNIVQGNVNSCWLLSALSILAKGTQNNEDEQSDKEYPHVGSDDEGTCNDFLRDICVARKPKYGIYGFVFRRDGNFIITIIDDYLYTKEIKKPDYSSFVGPQYRNGETDYTTTYEPYWPDGKKGSQALYFSHSKNLNETWVPLIEKAYAKIHGDYSALDYGFSSEAVEDLVGGVSNEYLTDSIVDNETFWKEVVNNKNLLRSCWTGAWGSDNTSIYGITGRHSYAIMDTIEIHKELAEDAYETKYNKREIKDDERRLIQLSNPTGKGEWNMEWSDGSSQWTKKVLEAVEYRQDLRDGVFWINYKDFLRTFHSIETTRLVKNKEKLMEKKIIPLSVTRIPYFQKSGFTFTLQESRSVVITASQMDTRYFRGLEGQYVYRMELEVRKVETGESNPICWKSRRQFLMKRSVNLAQKLEAGKYDVYIRIKAQPLRQKLTAEDAFKRYQVKNPDKAIQMAMHRDLAYREMVKAKPPQLQGCAKETVPKCHEKLRTCQKRIEAKVGERDAFIKRRGELNTERAGKLEQTSTNCEMEKYDTLQEKIIKHEVQLESEIESLKKEEALLLRQEHGFDIPNCDDDYTQDLENVMETDETYEMPSKANNLTSEPEHLRGTAGQGANVAAGVQGEPARVAQKKTQKAPRKPWNAEVVVTFRMYAGDKLDEKTESDDREPISTEEEDTGNSDDGYSSEVNSMSE